MQELIPANEATVSVNPFRIERHVHQWQPGESLEEILRAVQPDTRKWRGTHIFLDDIEISPEYYHVVRPKPNTLISIKILPADNNILRSVAFIALAVASFYAGPWGIAVYAVGSLAINALIPPMVPELDNGEQRSQSLAIGGSRNRLDPYGQLPVILGTTRITPPYAARPYTELRGDQQYVVMLFAVGMMPLEADRDSIRLGNTPLSAYAGQYNQFRGTYADVQVEMVTGGSDDDDEITLYKDTVYEEVVNKVIPGGEETGYAQQTTAANAQAVDFTIEFPLGLIKYDKNDDGIDPRQVIVTVEWSRDQVNWSRMRLEDERGDILNDGEVTFKAKSPQPIRKGFSWYNFANTPGEGQYHIRMRADVNNRDGGRLPTTYTKRVFSVLRSWRNEAPVKDPTCALLAIRVKATDQLSGTPDQVNLMVQSILPDYDNGSGTWIEKPTNNPASISRHLLTGNCNQRAMDVARLSDAQYVEFWKYCANDPYGDLTYPSGGPYTYNRVIDSNVNVHDTNYSVCGTAFARPIEVDGIWGVFIDHTQSTARQTFTPRNSWGFQMTKVYAEPLDGYRIRFIDETDDLYQNSERIVYADGKSESNNTGQFEALEAIGITNPDQIWKYGRRFIAIGELQPENATLSVDAEALVTTVGDLIHYQDDAILVGLGAGRVKTIDEFTVTLDTKVPMGVEPDGTYALQFRLSDNTSVVAYVETESGWADTLTFFPALGAAPAAVGDLAVFGEGDKITFPFLIKNIDPKGDLSTVLSLVPYAEGVYTSADQQIPPYDPLITAPPGSETPVITEINSDEYVMYRDSGGTLQPLMLCTIGFIGERSQVQSIIVQFRVYSLDPNNAVDWTSLNVLPGDTGLFRIQGVTEGQQVEVRSRFLFKDGTSGDWATFWDNNTGTPYHTVIGATTPPPDVDDFSIIVQASGLREYHWNFFESTLLPPDLDGFQIRYYDADVAPPGAEPVGYTLMNGDVYELINTEEYVLQYSLTLPDWEDMTPLTIGRITHEPFEFNAPFAGSYYLAIKALDVGGRESTNARYTDPTDPVTLPPPQLGNSLFYFDAASVRWLEADTPGAQFIDCRRDPTTGYLVAILDNTWASQQWWNGGNETWAGSLTGDLEYYLDADVLKFDQPYTAKIRLETSIEVQTGGTNTYYWSANGDNNWQEFDDTGVIIDPVLLWPGGINSIEFRLVSTAVPTQGVRNWVVEGYASA